MPYGYFDDAAREYVITTPKTPVKWINYIGTLAFGGFVDQTGGALLCKEDPALNRITKYIPQMPASDFKGTTLYLRLREGGTYRIFSPFFVPTLDRFDLYECHVGLGYTRIVSEFHGIHTEVTVFVPIGGSQEWRDIRVTSLRDGSVDGAGIKISAPGFDGFDPAKGGVTTYPPGAKENGGIFLHTNPWVIIAETLIGRGDQAYAYYSQINPAARNDRLDEFECEPYVYPQNILGDEHPQFGLARNSWLSGTASWMLQAGMGHILGIRPAYGGLEIDPCIPADWDGFRVRREFRGAVYEIDVRNPYHGNKGVKSVVVDGIEIAGNVVPAFDAGLHCVEVSLG